MSVFRAGLLASVVVLGSISAPIAQTTAPGTNPPATAAPVRHDDDNRHNWGWVGLVGLLGLGGLMKRSERRIASTDATRQNRP
ncbi:WGxxGxxG family protein [Alsobacter sp. SYSU BS001988]